MAVAVVCGRHTTRAVHYQEAAGGISVNGEGLGLRTLVLAPSRAAPPTWDYVGEVRGATARLDAGMPDQVVVEPQVGLRTLVVTAPGAPHALPARLAVLALGMSVTCEARGARVAGGQVLATVMDRVAFDLVMARPPLPYLPVLADAVRRQRAAGYARELVVLGDDQVGRAAAGALGANQILPWPQGTAAEVHAALTGALAAAGGRLVAAAPGIEALRRAGPQVTTRAAALARAARAWAARAPAARYPVVLLDLSPGAAELYAAYRGRCWREELSVWASHAPGAHRGAPLPPGTGLAWFPDAAAVARWLPAATVDPEVVSDDIANCLFRPGTRAETEYERWLCLALARVVARAAVTRARANWPVEVGQVPAAAVVVTGEVVAHARDEGQVLLAVADVLEPVGITPLYLDRYGLLPVLGTLVDGRPPATSAACAQSPVALLGTLVSPLRQEVDWEHPRDHTLAIVGVEVAGGDETVFRLQPGMLLVAPGTAGRRVRLTVHPAPGFDFGAGPGTRWEGQVDGGRLGLVFDARGRPLALPGREPVLRSRLLEWLAAVREGERR